MSRASKIRKEAQFLNQIAQKNWYMYLKNLYLNIFEWSGFPDTVDLLYFEDTLHREGKAGVVRDPQGGILTLPVSGSHGLNIYFRPTSYIAIGNNYSVQFNEEEMVRVRENYMTYPMKNYTLRYAHLLADTDRTIEVYSKTMKRPFLLYGDQQSKLSNEVYVDSINSNELLVSVAQQFAGTPLQAKENKMDGTGLLNLWRHKKEIFYEYLTFIGINSANTDKPERLISAEVDSNNQIVRLNIDTALDCRKEACEEMKSKMGLDISVKLKHDYIAELTNVIREQKGTPQSGGGGTQ